MKGFGKARGYVLIICDRFDRAAFHDLLLESLPFGRNSSCSADIAVAAIVIFA